MQAKKIFLVAMLLATGSHVIGDVHCTIHIMGGGGHDAPPNFAMLGIRLALFTLSMFSGVRKRGKTGRKAHKRLKELWGWSKCADVHDSAPPDEESGADSLSGVTPTPAPPSDTTPNSNGGVTDTESVPPLCTPDGTGQKPPVVAWRPVAVP